MKEYNVVVSKQDADQAYRDAVGALITALLERGYSDAFDRIDAGLPSYHQDGSEVSAAPISQPEKPIPDYFA